MTQPRESPVFPSVPWIDGGLLFMGLLGGPWNKVRRVPVWKPVWLRPFFPRDGPAPSLLWDFLPPRRPWEWPGVGSAESHRTHLWVLRLRGVPINPPLSLWVGLYILEGPLALCCPSAPRCVGSVQLQMEGGQRAAEERSQAHGGPQCRLRGRRGKEDMGAGGGAHGSAISWRPGVWVPHTAPRGWGHVKTHSRLSERKATPRPLPLSEALSPL